MIDSKSLIRTVRTFIIGANFRKYFGFAEVQTGNFLSANGGQKIGVTNGT